LIAPAHPNIFFRTIACTPIAAADLLVTVKAGIDQFTDAYARDPKVLALRSKVEVVRNSAFSIIAAAVEITTANGKTHKLSQPAARGSDVNSMSDKDLEEKIAHRAGKSPQHDVARMIDAIWALVRMFPGWRRWPCRRS
jgi:2-methylcitrate dehydratase PrpD